jgi:hypothetical protein
MTFDSARPRRKRASKWSRLPDRADSGASRSELSRSTCPTTDHFGHGPKNKGASLGWVVQALGGRPAPLPGPTTLPMRVSVRYSSLTLARRDVCHSASARGLRLVGTKEVSNQTVPLRPCSGSCVVTETEHISDECHGAHGTSHLTPQRKHATFDERRQRVHVEL